MTITYRSSSNGSGALAAPSGLTDDDMMIAVLLWDNGASAASGPAGWTLVHEEVQTPNPNFQISVFFKVASSESGTYAFTGGTDQNGTISAFSDSVGGGTWSIPDDSVVFDGTGTTSVTTAVDVENNDVLVCSYGNDGNIGIDTAPAGMTERVNILDGGNGNRNVTYSEAISGSSSPTRTLEWDGTEQSISSALVLRYTAAAGGGDLLLTNRSIANYNGIRE